MARYSDQRDIVASLEGFNAETQKVAITQNDMLSRKSGDGPNMMETDLDMNSNRILNLPEAVNNTEPLRKIDGDVVIAEATAQADRAEQEADDASASATSAANSASAANIAKDQAEDAADRAEASADSIDARFVDTISEAIALDVPVGTVVETQGYYSLGDGGANQYIVVAAGSGAEDGGLFIDMDNGSQLRGLFLDGALSAERFGVSSKSIYVSTTGNDSNQGTLSSSPFLTAQAAFNFFDGWSVIQGKWIIEFEAGTYGGENSFPPGVSPQIPIVIKGPDVGGHPNVPTAIFDGTGISSAFGFEFKRRNQVFIQDIKFQNYGVNGVSDSGAGISAIDKCLLATKNVHTENCYDGILSYRGRLLVSGGVYKLGEASGSQSDNFSAIKSMLGNEHSIGALYDIDSGKLTPEGVGEGPIISSIGSRVGRGVFLQELATGHTDGLTVDNVSKAIECVSRARAHVGDSDFKNCAVVGEIDAGSDIFDGGGNTFNEGTADANDRVWYLNQTGVQINEFNDSFLMFNVARTSSPDNPTVTGTTSEQTVHTFSNFFNGYSFSREGTVRVRVAGDIDGNAGTKTFRLRYGSLANILTFAPSARGSFDIEMEILVTGTDQQLLLSKGVVASLSGSTEGSAEAANQTDTATLADGTPKDLTVNVLLADGADSVDVKYIEVLRGRN